MATTGVNVAFTEAGRRDSRPRRLVRAYLDECEAFVSAQQIHDDLRSRGDKVGLATVYRNLQAMTDAGEVDALRHNDETLFRKCNQVHHHHLVCRECGLTVEIAGPAVERWAARAADDHGFIDVTHVLELFGLCRNCA